MSCHLQGDVKQQVADHSPPALPPEHIDLTSSQHLGDSPQPSLTSLWPLPQTHSTRFLLGLLSTSWTLSLYSQAMVLSSAVAEETTEL